jgi:hypothetical protein
VEQHALLAAACLQSKIAGAWPAVRRAHENERPAEQTETSIFMQQLVVTTYEP